MTELGWAQMRTAAGLSDAHQSSNKTPNWTHVFSSPLSRCCEFAERTAASGNLAAVIEDQWQEIDYGDWDGMPLDEWRKLAAPQFKEFRQDMSKLSPPNGENFIDFKDRILAAWMGLSELPDKSHVLVVTHGGVLRVVLPHVLGMPLNRSFPLYIPFACFSRIRLNEYEGKVTASLMFHNGAEYQSGAES